MFYAVHWDVSVLGYSVQDVSWNSLFVTEISSSESVELSADSEVALNTSGPFAWFCPEPQCGPTIRDDLFTCTI